MIRYELETLIQNALKDLYSIENISVTIEHPTNDAWGDYSTNIALLLSKDLKQNSLNVANDLVNSINNLQSAHLRATIAKIDIAGPGFINFYLSPSWFLNNLDIMLKNPTVYGSSNIGNGKLILVEYSGPNTNKPLHIGHSRNNFIGSSLAKIYKFLGYNIIRTNYINDIGVHICKSMLMYKLYGDDKTPDIKSDHFVGEFYKMFEKEVEKNPDLLEQAKDLLRKWEAKDPETLALWTKMNNWVYEGWKETYENENVEFEIYEYGSQFNNIGKEIAEHAVQIGIAEKDETGAIVARLEAYGMPDKVLLRSDGTAIYSTQDLQLAKDSYDQYHFDKRLYVVDHRQGDYFKQIFTVLKLMGFEWADRLHHVSYGEVRLPGGAMSSRKGQVINADDVYSKLIELETTELTNRGVNIKDKSQIIKDVSLAAYRYPMLKVDPKPDITFDYSYVTKFEGDTGPYLQYTYARANSVLNKAQCNVSVSSSTLVLEDVELKLIKALHKFPEIVLDSGSNFAPNMLANYLFDVAQLFNSFYNQCPILNATSDDVKMLRLSLTQGTTIVLSNGLSLLGINAPERM